MTERKPHGMSAESWVEQQISDAADRGDFDNLPGSGKALPPGDDGEDWWIRGYLQREDVPADTALPMPLLLRKEAEDLAGAVRGLPTEDEVRATVADLNRRIEESWRLPAERGLFVRKVDTEAIVAGWWADRPAPAPEPVAADPEPALSWWRRLARWSRQRP
ncbi:DUF1992 domain-containing protein [Actinoplanes sp. NEAU-A12]|uniref:DUF1992 domain-containing protein n=1 Tax=Actinoplanes sandaracinus TaxID=3045177 RepID=A0ABT6WQW8_9ACTN|nr:DUF1992 domain-containing protein [Actinoplanes sandaracinus]MDI6102128.1 DUF1992 domain-containing protein [Actinoplanes sandaracinus]